MIRNLRFLGVSLLVVMAGVAVMASPASATKQTNAKFTAAFYPAFVHGETKNKQTHFKTEAGSLTCDSTVTGTLQEASQVLTVSVTTTNCEAFGFLEATVSTTGCYYVYRLTTETVVGGTEDPVYQAHMDKECEAGKAIIITAGTCKVEVKAQTGLTTVDFHNMTGVSPKDLTMQETIQGTAYTVVTDGFLCPFAGTGNKVNGESTATESMTLMGYKEVGGAKGEQINLDIG